MILYHGSDAIIDKPIILKKYRAMDFGGGFYTTTNKEQAKDFSQRVFDRKKRIEPSYVGKKYVSIYEIDADKIKTTLKTKEFLFSDEEWFDFVEDNRFSKYNGENYSVIIGPVANDTIYRVFVAYEAGILSKQQAIEQLKVRELYNQLVFTTIEALSFLKYIDFEEIK